MKKLKVLALALICAVFSPAKADEGMWLLQLMQEQNLADRMKAQGLKMDIADIYNPDKLTLKDAVGIFGGGCTGEIISPNGLILTNHHCGYGAIQQHSSVEHDYLTDGFWAKSYAEELPTPGLKFRFVERIIDVTDRVNEDIRKGKITEAASFGAPYMKKVADETLKKSDLKKAPGRQNEGTARLDTGIGNIHLHSYCYAVAVTGYFRVSDDSSTLQHLLRIDVGYTRHSGNTYYK